MPTPPTPAELVTRVSQVFDTVADDYDQSGVAFFAPIAGRLVELLDPRPGERVVDVGCGRGAVTLPLARAVGQDGSVTALDVSPAMVAHTRAAAGAAGLDRVSVELGDATALRLPERSFDVLASSLVLFFLPRPAESLPGWLRLLRPGGRAGLTTFGTQDDTWQAVDALFVPYLPPALVDPAPAASTPRSAATRRWRRWRPQQVPARSAPCGRRSRWSSTTRSTGGPGR